MSEHTDVEKLVEAASAVYFEAYDNAAEHDGKPCFKHRAGIIAVLAAQPGNLAHAERVKYEDRVLAAEMEAVRLRRFLASQGWTERLTPMCCIEGGTDISGCSCLGPDHQPAFYHVGAGAARAALPAEQER